MCNEHEFRVIQYTTSNISLSSYNDMEGNVDPGCMKRQNTALKNI